MGLFISLENKMADNNKIMAKYWTLPFIASNQSYQGVLYSDLNLYLQQGT